MPILRYELAHEGETLDEAIADIEYRYGVTALPVHRGDAGETQWAIVDFHGDADQLRNMANGVWDLPVEEANSLMTN